MTTNAVALYDQLLEISRTTFAEGRIEVAFHTLQAALAYARELHDNERVQGVLDELSLQEVQLIAAQAEGQQAINGMPIEILRHLYIGSNRQPETSQRLEHGQREPAA